jgi:DNA (cytosine-5)-methyltransferase 1
MPKPLLLDLFCGVGGSAVGYHRAGFEVVGVDHKPQPRYPFEFIQGDALSPPVDLSAFDAIHASPPCQGYSRTRHLPWLKGKEHPLLIPAVRRLLAEFDGPWVIENVEDSPLKGIALRGGMFGLPYRRLRKFESNILLMAFVGVSEPVGTPGRMFGNRLRKQHGETDIVDDQSIPTVYTEFIGKQLIQALC